MTDEIIEVKPKHPGGRPLKYTPVTLQSKVDEYFNVKSEEKKKTNWVGLANHLDILLETLNEYASKEEFSDILKKARQKCMCELIDLMSDKSTFTPGQIFVGKNFYGMRDTQEMALTGANGGPIQAQSVPFDYQKADPGKLKQLQNLYQEMLIQSK